MNVVSCFPPSFSSDCIQLFCRVCVLYISAYVYFYFLVMLGAAHRFVHVSIDQIKIPIGASEFLFSSLLLFAVQGHMCRYVYLRLGYAFCIYFWSGWAGRLHVDLAMLCIQRRDKAKTISHLFFTIPLTSTLTFFFSSPIFFLRQEKMSTLTGHLNNHEEKKKKIEHL